MARTATLTQMRTRIRQLANVEGDTNITDAELTDLVNRHLAEVYDILVAAGPADYYAASTDVTTSNGVIESALPADFLSLVGVWVHESSDERRALLPMGEQTRNLYKAPTGAYTVTLEYLPCAPTLSAGSDTFDGVNGWEELICARAARDVMIKREADPSAVMATAGMYEARIRARSRTRDRGQPKRTVDLDETTSTWPYGPMRTSNLACYRLRAGNIEFYEPLTGLP